MSNIAVLTWERWINSESCTPEREITLADSLPWEHTMAGFVKYEMVYNNSAPAMDINAYLHLTLKLEMLKFKVKYKDCNG